MTRPVVVASGALLLVAVELVRGPAGPWSIGAAALIGGFIGWVITRR